MLGIQIILQVPNIAFVTAALNARIARLGVALPDGVRAATELVSNDSRGRTPVVEGILVGSLENVENFGVDRMEVTIGYSAAAPEDGYHYAVKVHENPNAGGGDGYKFLERAVIENEAAVIQIIEASVRQAMGTP